jgi:D-alanyl-D-alanine dipeptidase/kynurenine formamidase
MWGRLAATMFLLVATTGRAGGPPVDPRATMVPALVELTALDPTIRLDLRYATRDNVTGRALYRSARAFLERPVADALVRVQRALAADGFGLVVYDAYRPWRVTKALWDATPPERREFVADPARGSRHNRGAAVDVGLVTLAGGEAVEMPSGFDDFSERASPTYAGGSTEARAHRDRLRAAMEREGFFVYPSEWWHFDYKDWADYPILDVPFDAVDAMRAPIPSTFDLARARIVDLTHPFDVETLYWPSAPHGFALVELARGRTAGGFFYAANAFSAPEHGGTHLDAPIHFAEQGLTADALPVRKLIAPGVVIDVRAAAAANPDYLLTPADIAAFESRHGTIPAGAIVLLRTGWGTRWPDRKRYFGDDTPGDAAHLHFPSYGKEAADLLVRERHVGALGVDTASIDNGASHDFQVHRLVMAQNVPGLENLAHLEELPETGAWIVALPMKIAGGSGGPLRIVAFLPR